MVFRVPICNDLSSSDSVVLLLKVIASYKLSSASVLVLAIITTGSTNCVDRNEAVKRGSLNT